MSSNTEVYLLNLVTEMTSIADNAQLTFGNLTAAQLNWKPSTDVWSIGQCFDHLITTNKAYIPIIEQVLTGKKQSTLWEKTPLLPNLFGKLLIKYLSPQSTRN
jgi:Na+-translocating ferredoxin:NAD+ oxidoreductase RnfD subunit